MKFTKKGVLALASFVLLVLQAFGLRINVPVVNEIIAAAASVLVMFGILTDSTEKKDDDSDLPSLPNFPPDGNSDVKSDEDETSEPDETEQTNETPRETDGNKNDEAPNDSDGGN